MALGEFLKEIKKNPPSVKFAEMANILVIHCQAAGEQRSVAFPLNQPCYHLAPLLSVPENLYWLEKGACQLWLHVVPVPWGLLSLSHLCLSCFVVFFFPPDDLIQLTAMCWMREFIQLAGRVMLPYSSGILTAVLPCLSYDDRKKSILVPELLLEAARSPAESQSLPRPRGREGRWGWGRGCGGSSAHA